MTDKIIDLELQHQKNPSLRESEPATTSSSFISSVFPALSPSPYGSKQRPKKTIMKKVIFEIQIFVMGQYIYELPYEIPKQLIR